MGLLGAFMPTIVFAVLAGVPSKYRDTSYTESNALSYVEAAAEGAWAETEKFLRQRAEEDSAANAVGR
jgi:hypothetical protein